MDKRTKRLLCLLCVLLVGCGATVLALQIQEYREEISVSGQVILDIPREEVTGISWTVKDQEPLSFHKAEQWTYDQDPAFPVDPEKIHRILAQFEEMTGAFIIEHVEDFDQYGFQSPACIINVETPDRTQEIQLGQYSKMDSQRYVSLGDGNVYLMEHDLLEDCNKELSDMILQDDIPDFDRITKLTFSGPENYEIVRDEDGKTFRAEDVYFSEYQGERIPLDTSLVMDYLRKASRLMLDDYVTYNATEEELQTYGFSEPDLVLTVEYPENDETKTLTLTLAREPGTDSDETGVPSYLRVNDSKILYHISKAEYDDLLNCGLSTMRHRRVMPMEYESISEIQIELDGNAYTLTSQKDGEERIFFYGTEAVDMTAVKSALLYLETDEFTQDTPTGPEEIHLTFTLDQSGNPKTELTLYRLDGSHCLSQVDGKTVGTVERKLAVDLIESLRAILLNEKF